MMGTEDLFKAALGDFADGKIENNMLAAKALLRAGLAILLIHPNGKKPICTLTSKQVVQANNAARIAARDNGAENWAEVIHPCGVKHVITDVKELNKAHIREHFANGCNLAVVPAACSTPVIAVDLDTIEECRGFLKDWADNDPEFAGAPMTVSSPGVMDTELDGSPVWVHKDGGHFWFTLPTELVVDPETGEVLTDLEGNELTRPVQLPERPGKLKGASGWTAYYNSGYVLVPPSVRAEGPYRLTGATVEAPAWLIESIQAAGTSGTATDLKERIASGQTDTGIDEWSAATPWADLLGAYDWTPTGRLDSCGCPTWTRPGQPAHAKSATAHEVGCPQFLTGTGHGPIHAWSDAVNWGGKTTVTKLTFLAWEGFGGRMSEAMAHIGVTPARSDAGEADVITPEELAAAGLEVESPKAEQGEDEPVNSWKPRDLRAILAGDKTRKEPTLLPRSDGRALFYAGMVHSLHGESESGKSLVLIGETARVVETGGDVLWITFDSDEEEDVTRLLRFGATNGQILDHFHYVRPEVAPTSSPEAVEAYKDLMRSRYALIVIDGVVDAMGLITAGAKGDPNEVFSLFFRILPKRLARTGGAVVMVDHVAKSTEDRGRFAIGAQAKMAAITGAAYVCEPDKDAAPTAGSVGTVVLRVGKDRPGSVRPHCGPRRARDRTQEAARITFDDTGERTVMTVEPPETDAYLLLDADADGKAPAVDLPFGLMQTVSEFLQVRPEGATKSEVEAALGSGKAERKRLAMRELVRLHYVQETKVGTAKILTSLVPYYVEYGDCDADVSGDELQDPEAS